MNKPVLLFFCTLAATGLLLAQPGTDRFAGLKGKIETLLNARLKPEPLPEKPANPFQFALPGAAAPVTGPVEAGPAQTTPAPTPLSDDEQILAYGVSRLRISGLVLRNGISHLLINSTTYKEGDLIPVRTSGDTVYYIRIVRIADSVTFGYNAATLVIPLPN